MRAFKLVRSTGVENDGEFKTLYDYSKNLPTCCATTTCGHTENRLKTGRFLLVQLRNLKCRLFVRFSE